MRYFFHNGRKSGTFFCNYQELAIFTVNFIEKICSDFFFPQYYDMNDDNDFKVIENFKYILSNIVDINGVSSFANVMIFSSSSTFTVYPHLTN